MKKLYFTLFSIIYFSTVFSQSIEKHFVKTTTYLDSTNTNLKLENIEYYDNFGRPTQSISIGTAFNGTEIGKDIVQPYVYDELGRTSKAYLPYPAQTNENFVTRPIEGLINYYQDVTQKPYAEVQFDNSPYNSVVKQSGIDDNIEEVYVQSDYKILKTTSIPKFKVENNNLTQSSTWSDLILYRTYNAENNITWSYYNSDGQMILSVQNMDDNYTRSAQVEEPLASSPSSTLALTFYVYDQFGLLRYTISPEGYEKIKESGITPEIINDYCYKYIYDNKFRLIEKKEPGLGSVKYAYDDLDRLLYTQNSVQRKTSPYLWSYTVYDKLSRVIETGEVQFRTGYDLEISVHEQALYIKGTQPNTYSYYDNYNFVTANDMISILSFSENNYSYCETYNSRIKGMSTGSKIRILDTQDYLYSVVYYDNYGRAIQTISQNQLVGSDISAINYNFAGNILATKNVHTSSNISEPVIIENFYSYYDDNKLWLKNITQTINGNNATIIEKYLYNDLGQVTSKLIGNGLQTIDYTYNINGALTNINNVEELENDFFAMQLSYNNVTGNISTQQFNTLAADRQQLYYSYDKANRLTDVLSSNSPYNETFTYDLNGNILSLVRAGQTISKYKPSPFDEPLQDVNYTAIDDLKYKYFGNKLLWVDDDAVERASLRNDFTDNGAKYDGKNSYAEFIYDANGNMVVDENKNIKLEYNYLDLPKTILVATGKLDYTYTAAGTKLQTVFIDGSEFPISQTTDYCGSFVYENNTLSYILTSYGRIIHGDGDFRREYYLTDHLGNIRVVFDEQKNIIQETHYYAHGLQISGLGINKSTNQYFYNGKELQEEAELNYLNYGWRQLDPQLGLWHSVDKMAEKYPSVSPYAYAMNNPVNMIDVAGLTAMAYRDDLWVPNQRGETPAVSFGGGGGAYRFGGANIGPSFEDLYFKFNGEWTNRGDFFGGGSESGGGFHWEKIPYTKGYKIGFKRKLVYEKPDRPDINVWIDPDLGWKDIDIVKNNFNIGFGFTIFSRFYDLNFVNNYDANYGNKKDIFVAITPYEKLPNSGKYDKATGYTPESWSLPIWMNPDDRNPSLNVFTWALMHEIGHRVCNNAINFRFENKFYEGLKKGTNESYFKGDHDVKGLMYNGYYQNYSYPSNLSDYQWDLSPQLESGIILYLKLLDGNLWNN